MNLMQPEPDRGQQQTFQSQTVAPTEPLGLTESSRDVRVLSERGFTAIFGAQSAEALRAFNADAAQRGPGAALDQLAERPGAYVPGVEPSPLSRAVAGSLRMSVPGGDARTDTPTDTPTETRTDSRVVEDTPTRTDTRTDGPTVEDPPEVRSVNGVTTETPFRFEDVGPKESQESVLRRAFEAYATRAGISDERLQPSYELTPGEKVMSPREMFVEERMLANRGADGEYRILNPDTQKVYGATTVGDGDDWTVRQEAGVITMYPTDDDIEALETALQQTKLEQGTRLAGELLEALKASEEFSIAGSLWITDPDARLASLMEQVSRNQGDKDFQRGLVDGLGVDGFIRLSKKYADQPVYSTTLARSLASAIAERDGVITVEAPADGTPSNIAVAIARQADSETLARLVANPDHSLGTEFLVEAAKSVRNGGERGVVLARAAEDPKASLQLLQDPDFVRDVGMKRALLRLEGRSYSMNSELGQFIKSGLSADMRDANPEQVVSALRTVTEMIAQYQGTPVPGGGLVGRGNYDLIDEGLATALTEAYVTNISAFSDVAGLSRERDGGLDSGDLRTLVSAIQPYGNVRGPKMREGETLGNQLLAATAAEYVRLMDRAAKTGNNADVIAAGNLAGAVLDGNANANLTAGQSADAQRAKLNQYILLAVGTATGGVGGTIGGIISKAASTELGSALKSNNAGLAIAENNKALNVQLSTNNVVMLSAFERASTEDRDSRTPEQRAEDAQFVRDLRTYDDALPPGAKILDGNGRLIRLADANDAQLSNMERLVTNKLPVGAAGAELEKAASGVSKRVQEMLPNVNSATTNQLRTQ